VEHVSSMFIFEKKVARLTLNRNVISKKMFVTSHQLHEILRNT
jgi:hypothetical protein